jgi:hypothetical protein
VELLQDQVIPNLQEGREWRIVPYEGVEVLKPRVQATEDVEDEDRVVDRRPEIGQSIRHVLELVAVLAHSEITLHKVTKGSIKVKGALLTVSEKLVLDSQPQVVRSGTTFPDHLMELRGDRVADPVEDDVVHPAPARIGGQSDVRVDVVEEGVALEDHHHQVTPAGVGGGGGVEDDAHEGADVEDGRCLEVKTGDDSLLIGGRGRRRVVRACGRARHKLASSDNRLLQGGRRLLLLQEGARGSGTAACSNRLFLGFLGVLDEGVEFGFEGSGVGGDVSRCGTHAGAEGNPRDGLAANRLTVAACWCSGQRCRPAAAGSGCGAPEVRLQRWQRPAVSTCGGRQWLWRPGGAAAAMAAVGGWWCRPAAAGSGCDGAAAAPTTAVVPVVEGLQRPGGSGGVQEEAATRPGGGGGSAGGGGGVQEEAAARVSGSEKKDWL